MMYDAIVVGARCAGASTAMLLARQGYRVLLVDRSRFPSDIMSTLIIKYPGVKSLKQWGLLDTLVGSNCPPIRQWTDDKGDFPLVGQLPLVEDVVLIAPRRIILDKILLDAAITAGAEWREDFVVTDVLYDSERVTGIVGYTKGGAPVKEHAQIVIGADGKHSKLASSVRAPVLNERPVQSCIFYSFWSGIPDQGVFTIWRHHRFVLAIPTHDGLTCLVVVWPYHEFKEFRKDIAENFWNTLKISPELYAAARMGRQEERFTGTVDLPNAYRKAYGPGWALVGDAGHHEDPVLAHGIMNAFNDAVLLSKSLAEAWSGSSSLADSLASFEKQRDVHTFDAFERAVFGARLEAWDKPRELRLRAILRTKPADASQYFGVRADAIPHEQFYNPRNIARILADS